MLKRSISIAIELLKPRSTYIMLFHIANRKVGNYEKHTDLNLFEIICINIQNVEIHLEISNMLFFNIPVNCNI